MFMYAKHGNLVDVDTPGAKASRKHLESRLEVIQGQAYWDHWKADEGLRIIVLLYTNMQSLSAFQWSQNPKNMWALKLEISKERS